MTGARLLIAALAAAAAFVPTATGAVELPLNDYPTSVRADYVFACMQTNGQTRDALEKCSCSVDAVAAIIPYSEYEATQTILSIAQRPGDNAEVFRSYGPFKEQVKKLKAAQVEAELRCF
jgi:hypothetical protein